MNRQYRILNCKYILSFWLVISLLFSFQAWGQELDNEISQLTPFIQSLRNFSKNIPQEKVYLHFDNTSYYQGDHIWFKCYIVTCEQHQLSQLSKTLYVELLNPGGEIIDKRILPIENGQCHGDFTLNQLPFYSGFYEVRAYTKYMLNFGDDAIFSRLLPVFNKPKIEGNYEEKDMLKYGRGDYPMKRAKPEKGKTVNLRFFPEGGDMIQGIASRVAFEATGEAGNPIDITGVVIDKNNQELYQFTTLHEGRGVFTYIPGVDKQEAVIEYFGKKYRFDLPIGLPQGVVMEVDNLSYADSIGITLKKSGYASSVKILGVAILSGGKLQNHCYVYIADDKISFKIDKTKLPSGVSQIVLFNSKGDILCDRLVFTGKNELLDIKAKTNKSAYQPYEPVDMEFSVAVLETNPANTTFSVSVRDAANEVESKQNILTDLLLMSEIKGYVRNPSYYFEDNNDTHRAALDVLLMVQGWRRYSWKQMAGVETIDLKYLPEQGIETSGKVVSLGIKQVPKPNVDVSLWLQKRGEEDETGGSFVASFVTGDQGRFSLVADVYGKWNMILGVTEKGKKKNYQIILDRLFSPESKRYRYADMQVNIAENNDEHINDEEIPDHPEEDLKSFFIAYKDSLAKLSISEKTHHLKEVTVTAKKRTKEQDIYHSRSTSLTYYDVRSESDNIYDSGKYIGDDIHQMLMNTNDYFTIVRGGNREFLFYKNKLTLFVIDYQSTEWSELGYFKYKNIRLSAIKSMYINENTSVISQYITSLDPTLSPLEIALTLGCVVLIETFPDGEVPVEESKGIRKTKLEGYSLEKEFYSPDYSVLPPEPDYRRTLYWNPSVTTDEHGHAKIKFYNNSSCTKFGISAETVTSLGLIGIYKNE